ncbi:Tim17/Tim22/Tim23/Pmp24 family-domain-containing protein [Radiomyces spectabilis]|uniref:Tim17/Tim22/Tim23/Pmp24 family-domain-containing protein n=1 Tax=Radiomyces spectabilis TaxID=64574 RepID=UPI00221FF14B|nr:Tim17/Tim22/Tim23/Pmp24 family-domain-containing protein [Radiomyces spectabilis]KAI8393349.1 Tim17/Tim22/Tim23/Pmp24 family-domain-containing protein [Radiomyces spectabilis]
MGLFGSSSEENVDDVYSPSANTFQADEVSDNSYEKMPDFMSSITYDATKLQPMALQGGIDFLQVDDAPGSSMAGGAALTPSRGWTDDLCYGTGTTYLAGLTLGGAVGLAEGMKKSADAPNMKIRLNTTLNTITRRGPGLGNSVGVIAMIYNGATAMIDASRGTHDMFNSIAGGAIAGAIFKSTAGTRAAAISSGVCAGAAGVWSFLVSQWSNN